MNLFRHFTLAVAAFLASFAITPAEAAVIYSFQSFSTVEFGPTLGSFTYVSPGFITTDFSVPTPANCTITTPSFLSCAPTQVFQGDAGGQPVDAIGFGINNGSVFAGHYFYYFPDGAFSAPGTYLSDLTRLPDQVGRLTVSLVPEPVTWLLLLAGIGSVGVALRRRRARVAGDVGARAAAA